MRANLLTKAGKEQWSIFTNRSTVSNQYLPSVAIKYTWQFVTNASFRITAAYGSSAPSANQLYGYYLFNAMDNYDYIGNPSLKNEKTFQTEVSLSYQRDILKFTTTGFYHRLFEYILGHIETGYSPLTVGVYGLKQYQNIPQAFVTGAEASVGINLKQGLQFLSTFTYSYGRMGNSKPIPMLSPLRGNIALRYGIKGWHIQAENDWATAKRKVNFLSGETPTPAFTLLNLRTGYKLVVKKHILTCNFSVENVLDTKYRMYSDWGNVLRHARNFIVYLGYVFGM